MWHKHHRPNALVCDINATGFATVMVVVVFTLLLIAMTAVSPHHGVTEDLPRVGHPISMWQAARKDALVVCVMRDGTVFFRNDRVSPDQLPGRIREGVSLGSESKVYIRADARAKYGWVAEVLDSVRSAGIEKIGFLVEQRPAPNPGP